MDNNKLTLDTIESLKNQGMTDEEAISAYEKAYEEFDKLNTPRQTYATASKYGIPPERIKRQVVQSHLQSKSPLNLGEFDAAKQAKFQRINALKDIGTKVGRFGISPIATALSAKDTYEDLKEGNYGDAAIDATGIASGLAGVFGSTMALPLAAPVLARDAGRFAGEYQWSQIPESIQKEGITSLAQSLKKTQEDTPEAEKRRKILKEKFGLDVVADKDKPAPQKSLSRAEKQQTEEELDKLSNPEMVKKQDEFKAYEDALATSRVTNPRLTEGQHEMNALRAVRQLREKRDLEIQGKNPLTVAGNFLTGLFEESPEKAKQRRELARKEFDRANEVRKSMGLPERPMPKEYEEPVVATPTEESKKPYEFTSKQLTKTPAKSSGLDEGKETYPSFMEKITKEYPESPIKDYVKDFSDEELQDIAKSEAKRKSFGVEPVDYEKNKDVIDAYNEVADEEGIDRNLLLAHSKQESKLIPGVKNKEGTSTATGLGQLTVGAYKDVQRDNPEFKDISFEQLNDPKNIKLQAKAHAKYLKQLINSNDGDEELALRKYFQGGKTNKYYQGLADKGIDINGNPIKDITLKNGKILTAEEQITRLRGRGWDGPEADDYVEKVNAYKDMFVSGSPDSQYRAPAMSNLVGDTKEKDEATRRIRKYLSTGDVSLLKEQDIPLVLGPSANPFSYSQGIKDQDRLLNLKQQYDEMMAAKNIPADTKFTPVEGPDGAPFTPSMDSAPSSVPPPSITTQPSTTPSQEPSVAPSTATNENIEKLTQLQKQLEAARKRGSSSELLGNLGKAAERILAGGVGFGSNVALKPEEGGVWEQMTKDRDRPLEQFKQDIALQADDPNSEVSNSMRSILEQDLKDIGIKANLSGLSYNQMKEIYSPISSRLSKEEARREKKENKDTEKAEKTEAKEKEERNKFLDQSRKTFTKDSSMDNYLTVKNALNQIDDYLADPSPTKATALGYVFAHISDPKSVVRESELKLFGSSGSILDKIKEQASMMIKGQYSPEKARQLKGLIDTKLKGYESNLQSKVSGYIKGGERYGINEQDVVENILGSEFWEGIYKKKAIQDTADRFFKGDVNKATAFLKQRGDIQ